MRDLTDLNDFSDPPPELARRSLVRAPMMWSDYVISLVQGGERNVEVIRDAERTAGWMGSSESDFCQTVVNRAQSEALAA